ncbi:nucleoside recognition domain-containing protein [Sedimenticola thiotaurini]|uniref:Nucleoside recognition family protein n=1 Tax=Sedimenticola thiotaurini TaxID=1543721 RepID=A0A0F7JTB8_9GAMM|nr:nucleoside recognition domain-containing protein [Sedimenticola thiotaurini]AKH19741.1 nucleoside recognition family protein [Sedimenticola thiotaurini]
MGEFAEIILRSGKAGVELAFFVFLPVMVVMLTFMRLLEAKGVLDWITARLSPLLHPFGLPDLGIFALIQILFVSFAAPVATLAIMDRAGTSSRHIAASLAMVLACAQANVVFPMSAVGLNGLMTILISAVCAVIGASATYYLFARGVSDRDVLPEPKPDHPVADDTLSLLTVINRAGREAIEISVSAVPMLILALLLVNLLRTVGAVELLEPLLAPVFSLFDLPSAALLPIITKFIAGGTAMMGVTMEFVQTGLIDLSTLNRLAGFLIHPFDIVGIAILISAGPRVAAVLRPALYGAGLAIVLRTLLHGLLF